MSVISRVTTSCALCAATSCASSRGMRAVTSAISSALSQLAASRTSCAELTA